jgi:hypothetical protein
MTWNGTFSRSEQSVEASRSSHARDYDEAAAVIADLGRLIDCGLVVAVREPGGATRYGIASRHQDDEYRERGQTVLGGG